MNQLAASDIQKIQRMWDWHRQYGLSRQQDELRKPARVFGGGSKFFDVRMVQTGGSPGDETTRASWTYQVIRDDNDEEVATNFNPDGRPGSPNIGRFRRPAIGRMETADYGFGFQNDSGDFILIDCNEVEETEACPPPEQGPINP